MLTGLFDRTGLRTNIKKTETVTFLPGKISTCLMEEGYNARVDAQFWKSREGRRVSCDQCDADLAAGSLRSHLETQHDIFRSYVLVGQAAAEEEEPGTYVTNSCTTLGRFKCPVPGCAIGKVGRGFRDSYALRSHLRYRHNRDTVVVAGACHP